MSFQDIRKYNVYGPIDAAMLLARWLGKWVVYAKTPQELEENLCYWEHVYQAAPWLEPVTRDFSLPGDDHEWLQKTVQAMVIDEGYVITCESEEVAREIFKSTVGDDGPTELNPYSGPVRVYALLIDSDGNPVTENT